MATNQATNAQQGEQQEGCARPSGNAAAKIAREERVAAAAFGKCKAR